MTLKLLTEHHVGFLSLKGRSTGSSETTVVKMQHCSKSHVAAQMKGQAARVLLFFGGFCCCCFLCIFFKFVVASSITISVCSHHPVNWLTLNQRVSTANKLCQTVRSQIRPDFYSGQKSLAWSGSELFDTLIVLPKELFKKVNLVKKISRRQKTCIISQHAK